MVNTEVCGGPASDTGVDSPFLDIDHTNKQVQKDIIDWLKWLRKIK